MGSICPKTNGHRKELNRLTRSRIEETGCIDQTVSSLPCSSAADSSSRCVASKPSERCDFTASRLRGARLDVHANPAVSSSSFPSVPQLPLAPFFPFIVLICFCFNATVGGPSNQSGSATEEKT